MTELETLAKYEGWKYKKSQRIFWIKIWAFLIALLSAYIAGNLLCKVGLTETKKIFSYSWGTNEDDLKSEKHSKLPKDYTGWYKKVRENVWVKKWGKKEDYFTKGEIKKREWEKAKEWPTNS